MQSAASPSTATTPTARSWRVLVCDDIATIRHLLRINFELEGHLVDEAVDGTALLAQLLDPEQQRPDVVVLDVHMFPVDGWHTIKAIRAEPTLTDLPVVLLSAGVHGLDLAQAHAAGFDAVIAKPFDPDDLVALVSRVAASGRVAPGPA